MRASGLSACHSCVASPLWPAHPRPAAPLTALPALPRRGCIHHGREGVLLVDVGSPAWSVLYTNDAFTTATGGEWCRRWGKLAQLAAACSLQRRWAGRLWGAHWPGYGRKQLALVPFPGRRCAARRGRGARLLGAVWRRGAGARQLPGKHAAPPARAAAAGAAAVRTHCLDQSSCKCRLAWLCTAPTWRPWCRCRAAHRRPAAHLPGLLQEAVEAGEPFTLTVGLVLGPGTAAAKQTIVDFRSGLALLPLLATCTH